LIKGVGSSYKINKTSTNKPYGYIIFP